MPTIIHACENAHVLTECLYIQKEEVVYQIGDNYC